MSNEHVEVEVLPHRRVGEQVRLPDGTAASALLTWAASLVMVATWRGQLIALPLCMGIYLRPLGSDRAGRLGYLTGDGLVGLRFPGDPLSAVTEVYADYCLPATPQSQRALAGITALLACRPEPAADLDKVDIEVPGAAGLMWQPTYTYVRVRPAITLRLGDPRAKTCPIPRFEHRIAAAALPAPARARTRTTTPIRSFVTAVFV